MSLFHPTANFFAKTQLDLGRDEVERRLDMYRGCVQFVCDKLGIAVYFEKTAPFSSVSAKCVSSSQYLDFFSVRGRRKYNAKVVMPTSRAGGVELMLLRKDKYETEECLLEMFKAKARRSEVGLVEAESKSDYLFSSPAIVEADDRYGDDLYELGTYMALEDVLTSGDYWIAACVERGGMGSGRCVFKLLEGTFPGFCCRPEFDMRALADGIPKFKEIAL